MFKRKLPENIRISKVFISDGYLCAKPQKGNFDMIYRAGTSVDWNKDLKCLYYSRNNMDNNEKIELIKKAVQSEYSVNLFTDKRTQILI